MLKQWMCIGALGLCSSAGAAGEMPLEDYIIEQLECQSAPSPLPILEALEKAGKIYASDMLGYDSISCFRIENGYEVRGLKLNSVCVHEEDAAIRAKRPDLLYRGPGSSPGQMLSFGTSVVDHVVLKWYFDNVGTRHLNEAVSDGGTTFGDRTEISCNAWIAG